MVQNIDAPLVSEGGHIPSYSHQHNEVVFDYPTVGIPVPGKRYNSTKVKPEDMHIFDQTFLDLFKPYNVLLVLCRTLIAIIFTMDDRMMGDTFSVTTSLELPMHF